MPVNTDTQQAEAEKFLEPGRQRLQRAKIVPLHSSLGNKSETLSQKKKRKVGRFNKMNNKKKPQIQLFL